MGDGATFELWFRSTLVLREVDGRWQIVHSHESTPFHMDGSLRAAVDLTP
jgi:ketosteroid isomerase-like protein